LQYTYSLPVYTITKGFPGKLGAKYTFTGFSQMTGACYCYNKATKWNELVIDVRRYDAYNLEDKTIGDMIKYHRLERGWSQSRLAAEMKLSKNQGRYLIKDYETRGLYPPKEISMKLAEVFNLETKYFYDEYLEFLDNSGEVILSLRKISYLSRTRIAELVGVTRETWTRWENGGIINRENYEKIKVLMRS
jgi:transcriptional regulator with XRE-family HTH domain